LSEKFFLPCRILEAKSYNEAIRRGNVRPFEGDEVVICSYQFAKGKASDVHAMPWDLVVIDEAHRLRNVYKSSTVIAQTLKTALAGKRKLLLTATPLQNSLLELFGLVSFIDAYAFGDLTSFRAQYSSVKQQPVFEELRARLRPICHRTLRRQVLPYVRYTKRLPMVQPFTPEESEDRLYELVSDYLRRDNLQALPASQRALMTLVLRKLLASSTFAIAGALQTLTRRLERKLGGTEPAPAALAEELGAEYEALDETADEWPEERAAEPLTAGDRAALVREIADLRHFTELALSVEENAKGKALLVALERAFTEADRLGAPRKAVVFTESRRTQDYLLRVLADSPFAGSIVLFNGSNTDPGSRRIYTDWLTRHAGSDRVTGSRTADMRSALVDEFRERGQILIATEAGAEGINLQFCSLVVNYDLPWNPQRIEQRIGRCHRYGQQHDVVVVNFLNQSNAADQRVFELLAEKFQLFEGVFGVSDEVLGAIESGVDFEKRIAAIYHRCRTPEEIQQAFDDLQRDLGQEIDSALAQTRQQLLDHFDDEVREKLRVRDQVSRAWLNRSERMLMTLTRHELNGGARFVSDAAFDLLDNPFPVAAPLGRYELPRRSGAAHLYRLNHPLAEAILRRAVARELPPARLCFDYASYAGKITALEPLIGAGGWLALTRLTIAGPELAEDHTIVAAITDDGDALDPEIAARLFSLPAVAEPAPGLTAPPALAAVTETRVGEIVDAASERNGRYFDEEMGKLDAWADDRRVSLRAKLNDLDREIAERRKLARQAGALPDKLAHNRAVNQLERKRDEAELEFRAAGREIDQRKDELLNDVERRLRQDAARRPLFTIQWRIA
ncbi:MAG: DEAD/DEAH box helicase, partial [Thermomicrobiales bacterium]|nr:DEAD/DEAH box helicase [Thermomicrobiales bacterium]